MDAVVAPVLAALTLDPLEPVAELPPILAGAATPQIKERVERFYLSIPEIFEAWVKRCESPHTQRAYRADVSAFIAFFGVVWPKEAWPAVCRHRA